MTHPDQTAIRALVSGGMSYDAAERLVLEGEQVGRSAAQATWRARAKQRDEDDRDAVLVALKAACAAHPTQRVAQVIVNALGSDPFYVEDRKAARLLADYAVFESKQG
jgi:hypothetical protein